MTTNVPDLEELFTRDPLLLTREDIMATLPAWRQARAKFMLAPEKAVKPLAAPKKTIDLSAFNLVKK